jgi:hypothetical protein
MNTLSGEFIQLVRAIPWFAHIGDPIENPALPRLHTWDKWGNPEDPQIIMIHLRQQDLYDEILQNNASCADDLAETFDHVIKMVIELARERVPYDKAEDSYYAPNTAVYHAGWTAGLVALCQMTDREPPPEIAVQWHWFRKGHWPAAFVDVDANDEPLSPITFRIL